MTPLQWRSSWRHFQGHPWLTGLAVFSIALGVAVVTAVDLANSGAMHALRLTVQSLSGQATHRLLGPPAGVPEAVYPPLRHHPSVRHAAPVVQGSAITLDPAEQRLAILGIDILAESPFRPHLARSAPSADLKGLLLRPNSGFLLAETAEKLRLKPDTTFRIVAAGQTHPITLLGLLDPSDPLVRQGLSNTLVVDIATAQELLGMTGLLSRVDLVLDPDAPPLAPPTGLRLIATESRTATLEAMTRSFRMNLTVLSLLALMVGMFIIYNTITFSVVRRRHIIGLLRAQGVTRREIFRQLLADGLLLGLPGTLLGIGLGILLGEGLVGLVARTINDIYFALQVTDLHPAPLSLAKGVALGIGASLVATVPPAWEATSVPATSALARSTLEGEPDRWPVASAASGVAALLGCGLLLAIPTTALFPGFAALALFTVGAALLCPILTMLLLIILKKPMKRLFGFTGVLANGGVWRNLSRTGVAVAAVTAAVATAVGMGIMIQSFRSTVVHWLERTVASDIYVSVAGTLATSGSVTLEPELIRTFSGVEGVASVGLGRRIILESPRGSTRLFVLDIDRQRFAEMLFIQGDAATIWPRFQSEPVVVVSESYAFHQHLGLGDRIALPTPDGEASFAIAGIFSDFRADSGMVAMSRNLFRRLWRDDGMITMGIRLKPGADLEEVMARMRELAGEETPLEIRDNRTLRQASMEIFDRTFAITRVLRLLAVMVAFFGVLTALMAIELERSRELAVFRALGMTPGELRRLITLETGLVGLVAGLIAIPMGWILGNLLIQVINYRSFGWTLHLDLDPLLLLQALVIAVPTAMLAGVLPARRMARTSPAEALREA